MELLAQALAPAAIAMAGAVLVLTRPWRGWLALTEAAILLSLVRLWAVAGDAPIAVTLYSLLPGIALQFRIDRIGLVLVGAPTLVTLLLSCSELPRAATHATRARAWTLVAQAALAFAAFAAGLATLAAAWAGIVVALTLAAALTRAARVPAGQVRLFAIAGGASALLTAAGAAAVQAAAGTTSLAAVPPDSITPAAAALLLTMPVMVFAGGGLLLRASRPGISLVAAWAILVAAGAGALVRLHDAGGGQLPGVGSRPALVAVGGMVALGMALSAWWAADLAAAVARIVHAGGCLVLVGAGLGGGLAPLLVLGLGMASVLVAAALLSAVEAGGGSLPGSRLSAPIAAVALAAAAGLCLGPGFWTSAVLVRAALDAGAPLLPLAVPGLLTLPAIAIAALLACRFGASGGVGEDGSSARLALAVGAGAAAAIGAAAAGRALVGLTAAQTGLPAAQLQRSLDLAFPPSILTAAAAAILLAAALTWALLRTRRGLPFWPVERAILPPRLTFVPRLAAFGAWHWVSQAGDGLGRRAGRLALAAGWTAAVAAAAAVFLR